MPRKKKTQDTNSSENHVKPGDSANGEEDRTTHGTRLLSTELPRLKIVGLEGEGPAAPPPSLADLGVSERRRQPQPVDRLRDGYFQRRTRLLDFLLAIILAAASFASVSLTYKGFGHSWDEALYLHPSMSAAQWVWDLARGDKDLLKPIEIDKAWGIRTSGEDPLHPEVAPIPKVAIGLGLTALTGYGVDEMVSMRLPIAIAFAFTVGLLYILGARAYGRLGGFAAAVCYVTMPRVFGHAHIAASETLLAFATVLLVWAFLAGIQRWPMAIFTAVAFALAVDTKVTALFLPLPLFLWGQAYYRRDYASNVFAMLFISPLVALSLWPWLWNDPLVRFADYMRFYAGHQSTAVFYLRQMYGYLHPPAPWHYPLVITAVSLPVWILVLSGIGIIRSVAQLRSRPVPVLFLLIAVVLIGVCSLPDTPKYDGERLFFGAFAFLALLAGGGFAGIANLVSRKANAGGKSARWPHRAALASILFLAGWGAWTLKASHPNQLNFFNILVGGPRGAMEKGFETSYWGEAVNEDVLGYLNSVAKPGMKVKPLALNELAFQNLQGWARLSGDVNVAHREPPFDLYILQVRQGFFGRVERALHFGAKPLKSFDVQGIPRIQVFSGDALTTKPDEALSEQELTRSMFVAPGTAPPPADTPAPPTAAKPPAITEIKTRETTAPSEKGAVDATTATQMDAETTGKTPTSAQDAVTTPTPQEV